MADAMGARGRQRTLRLFTFEQFRDRLLEALTDADGRRAGAVAV
jgi:hypothetical protein